MQRWAVLVVLLDVPDKPTNLSRLLKKAIQVLSQGSLGLTGFDQPSLALCTCLHMYINLTP